MATSGRFLTTHVGSLPRPDDLIAMMWAREDGIPVDTAAMEERVYRAVDEAVARQIQAGIDIVNDGEWGKPSYATYIKDRLNGFGGTGNTYVFQDIEAFPQTKARVIADPGRKHRKAPACDAPISVRDVEAPRKDAERLQAALKAHGAAGAFLSAASPDGTAYAVQGPRPRRFSRAHGAEHRGAQPRAGEHSGGTGPHAFVLGQLSRSAPLRRAASGHRRRRVEGEAARDPIRGGEPSPRPRVGRFRDRQGARRQGADTRRHRMPVQLHRASGARRAAHRAIREACRPRE